MDEPTTPAPLDALTTQRLTQAFTQHLAQEIRLLRDFLTLLDEEAHALSTPDAGQALHATTVRKHGYADQLQAAALARAACLAKLGFADVREDLSPVVRQYPNLRPAIDALIDLAAQARAKNQENGLVIQRYQRQYQDALSALRTLTGAGANHLYDARGHSKRVVDRPFRHTYSNISK